MILKFFVDGRLFYRMNLVNVLRVETIKGAELHMPTAPRMLVEVTLDDNDIAISGGPRHLSAEVPTSLPTDGLDE